MPPPAASVIVRVHDAETTLPALLRSLAAQDWGEPYEVIVADDGSADASAATARSFAGDLPVTVCALGRRRGPSAAGNAGAARAGGPILAFCDADDVVDAAWLRTLCAAVRRHPLVAGAVHHLPPDALRPPPSAEPFDPDGLDAYYDHLPWTMAANLGVRREVFADAGGFAEDMWTGQDADLCWRLAARGVELAREPDAIVYKRARAGALPTFRQYLRYGLGHPLLFRRHRPTGMPRRSGSDAARRYAGTAVAVARGVRHPRSPEVSRAAARLGQDLGRLAGSVRWRSLYL